MDLVKAKAVNQRDEDLTFGYLREAQLLLPNDDNPYYNIPEIVAFITVLYFHMAEYFEFCGDNLNLSDDRMTVKYVLDYMEETSAYGAIRINQQDKIKKYIWTFRVENIDNSASINFGIVESNCELEGDFKKYGKYCSFESLFANGSIIADACDIGSENVDENAYPEELNDGDIATMELDLNKQRLYFFVNQKLNCESIKTALEDDKQYKLVICLDDPAGVTLIDFEAS